MNQILIDAIRSILFWTLSICLTSNRCIGRRGRVRMVVGFTTPYAISANHH